ncbi:FAD-dependent oxidoreductase [Candidatus Latescibacterota bacterium]
MSGRMILLTINDKQIEVEKGSTILEAAESLGIKIPTLCSHKALSPYGACRICLVEISQNNGPSSIQASCTYPTLDGLSVLTDSERVIKTRKIMIELLRARCPDSEEIKNLARELGVEKTRIKPKNKDCTLCGLCVRMCQERMGRGAISFSGRGSNREITSPFGTPSDVCQTCGACDFICPTGKIDLSEISKNVPVPIPFEYNEGLNSRPAIYIPYPQAIPNKATIDDRYCAHMLRDECEICKEFCEAEAIDYEQKGNTVDLQVGSVILSPGYDIFDAGQKLEYGYLNYPNVVTALEFERILSASGPYLGEVLRPSDRIAPKKIAFIQCVGSRDTETDYCSSICCMYATKEAIIAKEHAHEELECHIYYIDLRAFGKGFDAYYERAKELGVKYIRCRPSSIEEISDTKNLKINYITDDDKMLTEQYDLVILSVGLQPPEFATKLNSNFGIKLNEHGYCWTDPFKPVESNREGIFVCGPVTEPKDIPETVTQASGAASKVLSLLSDVRGTLIKPKEYPPEKDVTGQIPRIGVFVCHCGTNIAGVVNISEVVEYAKTLQDVVYVENNLYTCSNDTQEKIKQLIEEHNLNRLIVASCTPRTHEPLFRNTAREAGLNPYLFEMANIRDQCSWVHMHEPEKATQKAKDLVRMAVAKSRLLEPLQRRKVDVNHSALVIGGGLSGMTSALEIAAQGYEVHLVEKEKQLGGNLQRIHYLLNGERPLEQLNSLIDRIKRNDKIHLYTDTKISNIEGFFGNFKTQIKTNSDKNEHEFEHGIVIIATGAQEYTSTEYFYGQDEKVVTQLDLENKLVNGDFNAKTVVMIQCVGSRDNERPYCSRVCCSEAVKNALKIKESSPETNIFILYRDIRTYGFRESYYRKARELGVIFIRYEEDRKPEVIKQDGSFEVSLVDPILNMPVTINTDLLVLSVATVPYPENNDLAQMLKIPLNQDNFFLEAHMKLRPIDFATDGVFLCGLAHSAKSTEESIIQACGAAARASTILSKDKIELEANISQVVDKNCDGCAYCIDPCPYNALTLIEYMRNGAIKKTVEADESACKGCGVCQATCPKMGIFVRGFKLEQISAMVETVLEVTCNE